MAQKGFNNVRIKTRRDTSANWTNENPILLDGEVIIVDTNEGETRIKIGDGVKTYTQLPFADETMRNLISNNSQDISELESFISSGKIASYDAHISNTTIQVTAQDKATWNGKSDFSGSYNDLVNKPTIPSALADLESDSTHRTVTDTEKTAWNNKQDEIPANTYDAYGAAAAVQDNLDDVAELIPSQATSSNQLADKAFVNSSVQTATANFRGNWDNWTDVPTDSGDYPVDYAGSKVPTVNDYLVVVDASGYSGSTLEGTWRFKYSGAWATDGKSGWQPEYQVNETPQTAAQLAALNSNVTDGKVSTYDAHVADGEIHVTALQKTEWSGKGEAPTLNIETQTALTPSDNTIYAFTATSAVAITATGSTCPLYGSDILVTIGTGGSVTLSAVGTAGDDITAAAEGDVWEINILRGYAVCAKIGGAS